MNSKIKILTTPTILLKKVTDLPNISHLPSNAASNSHKILSYKDNLLFYVLI